MLTNFNLSLLKLVLISTHSNSPFFVQSPLQQSLGRSLTIKLSKFNYLLSPIFYSQVSSATFATCLFSHVQSTSIINADEGLIQNMRYIFQLDGLLISKRIQVKNCIFKYCLSSNCSGCMNFEKCDAIIIYNIFSSNSGLFGGAFHAVHMGSMAFTQNLIEKNTADHFGGVYIDVSSYHRLLSISQNNFTGNRGNVWVGACNLDRSKGVQSQLIFDHNYADQCAAYYDFASWPDFHNLETVVFLNNSARKRGGAVTCFRFGQKAVFNNCFFLGNKCPQGNCIYLETWSITATMRNCRFDCPLEKAIFHHWEGSKAVLEEGNVFAVSKDEAKVFGGMMDNITAVPKLEWFIKKEDQIERENKKEKKKDIKKDKKKGKA